MNVMKVQNRIIGEQNNFQNGFWKCFRPPTSGASLQVKIFWFLNMVSSKFEKEPSFGMDCIWETVFERVKVFDVRNPGFDIETNSMRPIVGLWPRRGDYRLIGSKSSKKSNMVVENGLERL